MYDETIKVTVPTAKLEWRKPWSKHWTTLPTKLMIGTLGNTTRREVRILPRCLRTVLCCSEKNDLKKNCDNLGEGCVCNLFYQRILTWGISTKKAPRIYCAVCRRECLHECACCHSDNANYHSFHHRLWTFSKSKVMLSYLWALIR